MSRQLERQMRSGVLLVIAVLGAAGACAGGADSPGQSGSASGAAGIAGMGGLNAGGASGAGMNAAGAGGAGMNSAGAGRAGMNSAGAGGAGMNAAGASGAGMNAAGASGASATAPTFTRVFQEVLVDKGCAGELCHGSGQGGLSMDDRADAYLNLVGVTAAGPSCMASGKMRVQPFMPDASLLLEKMSQPMPSCGDMMPIGARLAPNCIVEDPSACNTAEELQLVGDWIAAGALDD
jgi:hypothetical protein